MGKGSMRGLGLALVVAAIGSAACKSSSSEETPAVAISDETEAHLRQIDGALQAFETDIENGAPAVEMVASEVVSRLTNEDWVLVAQELAALGQAAQDNRPWMPSPALEQVFGKVRDLPYFRDLPDDSARLTSTRERLWGFTILIPYSCESSCVDQVTGRVAAESGYAFLAEISKFFNIFSQVFECGEALRAAQSCYVNENCVETIAQLGLSCLPLAVSALPPLRAAKLLFDFASLAGFVKTVAVDASDWLDECRVHQATSCRVDAGMPDAMSADAMPADAASSDASTGDGSMGDGSTGDGSTGDGSMGDGGMGDGGMGDGGATDASMPDAMEPDAAVDAAVDAPVDAEVDAAVDAGDVDAEVDASV